MALYYRQPHKLCVVWTRHGRRLCSEVHSWESMVDDPYRGVVSWSVPENITATVTLFHTGKFAKCEDKSWMFVIENVSTVNFCYPMSACNAYRARYCYSKSVCPSVYRMLILCLNEWTYCHTFLTICWGHHSIFYSSKVTKLKNLQLLLIISEMVQDRPTVTMEH